MKITLIISTLSAGGAERNIVLLANFLSKKFDVNILTLQSKDSNIFYEINSNIKISSLNILKKNNNFLDKFFNFFKRVLLIRKHLKKNKTELFISFIDTTNITVLISSLFLKSIKKRIISDRNNPYKVNNNLLTKCLKFILYNYTSYLVLQTHEVKKAYWFINKKKIIVISNFLTNQIKKKINYKFSNKLKIVAVGRLEDQKGYDILIRALSILKNKINFKCDIYGKGNKKKKIVNHILSKNLKNKIFLKGVRKKIGFILYKYDLYILSSRFEGYPNTLLEAMKIGMPIISSDCEYGPKEIIKNNFNGILFRNQDYKDQAKKIFDLYTNKKKLLFIGKNAKKNSIIMNINKRNETKWLKIIKK